MELIANQINIKQQDFRKALVVQKEMYPYRAFKTMLSHDGRYELSIQASQYDDCTPAITTKHLNLYETWEIRILKRGGKGYTRFGSTSERASCKSIRYVMSQYYNSVLCIYSHLPTELAQVMYEDLILNKEL